jgi:hypothetical protein
MWLGCGEYIVLVHRVSREKIRLRTDGFGKTRLQGVSVSVRADRYEVSGVIYSYFVG